MRSVVFCYAPPDAALARRIGSFLEANLPLTPFYEEGLIDSGSDLIETVGRALSAEIAIVLLSPEAVPEKWDRNRWEPVFIEQPRDTASCAIFAHSRDCRFPGLLKRQPFADLTTDELAGLREIKRLILKHNPAVRNTFDLPPLTGHVSDAALEPLRLAVVDRPGTLFDVDLPTALHLAHASKDDFEGAFWIDCSHRTEAGILGDIGHSLEIPLTGSPGQNAAALREFARQRRCLFLYEHLRPQDFPSVDFGSRFSAITITSDHPRVQMNLPQLTELFSQWPKRSAECLTRLADASCHLRAGATSLGEPLLALLKSRERLAEAAEVLDILIAAATSRGDRDALARYTWDRSWIWGHWGEPYNAAALPEPVRNTSQIPFNFA